jgi:hypothetical protein
MDAIQDIRELARHHEQLDTLKQIERLLLSMAIHEPIDRVVQISAQQPYVINYLERRHVYIWLPSSSLTLSFEDYGTGTVSAQIWVNLGMPQGIRVFAPAVLAPTPIYIRCTDEVIP